MSVFWFVLGVQIGVQFSRPLAVALLTWLTTPRANVETLSATWQRWDVVYVVKEVPALGEGE